jgi:hypothetical protein
MGFLDSLLGRTKPVQPNLDALFAVPNAAITLEVGAELRPTGVGSVCFRAAEGGAFSQLQAEIQQLLDADEGPQVEVTRDNYGFTWLVSTTSPPDISALVTDLHAVNSTLQDHGFGPQLLCSLVSFGDPAGRRVGLVYLYKRGTFYPFAPLDGERRDNALELQVRGLLEGDLRIEEDLSRWFPVRGAPGL